jgi:hypothetical protein
LFALVLISPLSASCTGPLIPEVIAPEIEPLKKIRRWDGVKIGGGGGRERESERERERERERLAVCSEDRQSACRQ